MFLNSVFDPQCACSHLPFSKFISSSQIWKNICLQLSRIGNDSFKNRILELDPATVPADIALGAKELLGGITFQKILCVSAGAAAFYVWVSKHESSVL